MYQKHQKKKTYLRVSVTVTVVKQGVCRGTLTWMCCVRKWALRHSSHTVEVTELYLQYFLLY